MREYLFIIEDAPRDPTSTNSPYAEEILYLYLTVSYDSVNIVIIRVELRT